LNGEFHGGLRTRDGSHATKRSLYPAEGRTLPAEL
jgi:hypothetical protein